MGLGVLMLLSTLGLAIGISAADIGPGQGSDAKGFGIGAGIWARLSLLIALFLSGMIASRVSDRPSDCLPPVPTSTALAALCGAADHFADIRAVISMLEGLAAPASANPSWIAGVGFDPTTIRLRA